MASRMDRVYVDVDEMLTALSIIRAKTHSPFLGLPGELRNQIYEYLLISTRENKVAAHPQILGVCKQTYEEGRDILYGDNVVNIEISPFGVKVNECWKYQGHYKRGDDLKLTWPDLLRLAWKVQITLPQDIWQSAGILSQERALTLASASIHSLAGFLTVEHCLRECHVDFESVIHPPLPENESLSLDHILSPLPLLGLGERLSAPGFTNGRVTYSASVHYEELSVHTAFVILSDIPWETAKRDDLSAVSLGTLVIFQFCLLVFGLIVPVILLHSRLTIARWTMTRLCHWYGNEAVRCAMNNTGDMREICDTYVMLPRRFETAIKAKSRARLQERLRMEFQCRRLVARYSEVSCEVVDSRNITIIVHSM